MDLNRLFVESENIVPARSCHPFRKADGFVAPRDLRKEKDEDDGDDDDDDDANSFRSDQRLRQGCSDEGMSKKIRRMAIAVYALVGRWAFPCTDLAALHSGISNVCVCAVRGGTMARMALCADLLSGTGTDCQSRQRL
jgi:hypothetical protein